ncbi:Crp/Fnr family transcriptional regulator [Fusobacterium polymorphum]|uniref:Crp/Fnr family transcriptional regulator n=1 Tax=Fusobacterium nucleatum subsp. polymorphum TaxID=76857 RepID=UPI0028D23AFF|nr:Crp/Fnr family transcriptional regulator [uncultured Fusobacterium sp.]
MISKEDIKHLEKIFPFWLDMKQNDRAKIILSSRVLSLKKNSIFFNSHELDGLLFLKSGKLRFFLSSLDARELPLYYLNSMEVEFFENFNAKTISTILDIAFIVEKNSEILLIPYSVLNLFRDKYSIMEKFLHNLTREKLSKSLLSLQNILLIPLKDRLLNFLYSLNKTEISLTHEEIAKNLGSSREVISRNLKVLEKENFLKINRKKIIILDRGEVL